METGQSGGPDARDMDRAECCERLKPELGCREPMHVQEAAGLLDSRQLEAVGWALGWLGWGALPQAGAPTELAEPAQGGCPFGARNFRN